MECLHYPVRPSIVHPPSSLMGLPVFTSVVRESGMECLHYPVRPAIVFPKKSSYYSCDIYHAQEDP
eukprot:9475032-Pyramimonas_sp.AAC.3